MPHVILTVVISTTGRSGAGVAGESRDLSERPVPGMPVFRNVPRFSTLTEEPRGPRVQLDPEPLMFHAEVVRRDGVPVGYLRAASYGFTLGGAVGLAMVTTPSGEGLDQSWLVEHRFRCEDARSHRQFIAQPMQGFGMPNPI